MENAVSTFNVLPPIIIGHSKDVVGFTINYKTKSISVNHHTRNVDSNADNEDFTSVTFDFRHLKYLLPELSEAYIKLNK